MMEEDTEIVISEANPNLEQKSEDCDENLEVKVSMPTSFQGPKVESNDNCDDDPNKEVNSAPDDFRLAGKIFDESVTSTDPAEPGTLAEVNLVPSDPLVSNDEATNEISSNLNETDLLEEVNLALECDHDETFEELKSKVLQLEKDRGQLATELMEKDVIMANLEREVSSLRSSLGQKEEEFGLALEENQVKYKMLKEESQAKILELKKQFHSANQDKESMVMKFALGEKEVIIQRMAKEEMEKKWKNALKERDDLNSKLKTFTQEKIRSQQLADSRLQDVNVLKREIERWKEEVKLHEAKVTVVNSRLKAETEAHKETRNNLDETIKHLSATREEIEITRKECADFMQKIRSEDEEQRKLKKNTEIEQKAQLIIDASAAKELESLKAKFKTSLNENNGLNQKIQKLECERLENEEQISKVKEIVGSQKQEINNLLAQVAEMESLKLQLQTTQEKCDSKAKEVMDLRDEVAELNQDMTTCRQKEAELLEFTQKLTDRNVILQSDLATLEAKFQALKTEYSRIASSVSELKADLSSTKVDLEEERKKRVEETSLMAKKLAEKTKQNEALTQQTLDAENEVCVQKRKNASSLRELTRELQNCQKKLSESERTRQQHPNLAPRSPSNVSLNKHDNNVTPTMTKNSLSVSNELNGSINSSEVIMPDSQKMIEKILNLQAQLVKKEEKNEFLEEHVSNLTEEVKKKNKIFQNYVMGHMDSGALSTVESDRNKRKMSESGGIMASLFSSKLSDSNMTLELSLEINQKLQAVLEDTLLKNITLKDNINTLGREIASLSSTSSKPPNDKR